MNKYVLLSLFWMGMTSVFGQSPNLVDIEFTPPEKAMIRQFTGAPVMPIEATNVQGNQVRVPSSAQKIQILIFTEIAALTQPWLDLIKELESNPSWEIHVFADDLKSELIQLDPMPFASAIPNCQMLSEAVFGSELGHNRLFLIDKQGLIQKVFVARELSTKKDVLSYVESFIPR